MRKDSKTIKRMAMAIASFKYFKEMRSPFYTEEDIEDAKLLIDLYNEMKPASVTVSRLDLGPDVNV